LNYTHEARVLYSVEELDLAAYKIIQVLKDC